MLRIYIQDAKLDLIAAKIIPTIFVVYGETVDTSKW